MARNSILSLAAPTINPNLASQWVLTFSPDGRTLAGSANGLLRVWDLTTGKEIRPVPVSHEGAILGTAASSDGKFVATLGDDMSVCLWDAVTGKELRPMEELQDENGMAVFQGLDVFTTLGTRVAFAPGGKLLAAVRADGSVFLWNPATGKLLHHLKGHENVGVTIAFSPNGKNLVTSGTDGRVHWWDTATGKQLRQITGPAVGEDPNPPGADFVAGPSGAAGAVVSPDGRMVAVGGIIEQGYSIQVWELRSGALRQKINFRLDNSGTGFGPGPAQDGGAMTLLAFAPVGNVLAWSNGGTIRTWDVLRGKELRHFGGLDGGIIAMAYSPGGKYLAAATSSGTIRLWDAQRGMVETDLFLQRGSFSSLAFLSDDTLVSGGAAGGALLWDVKAAIANPVPAAGTVAELWERLADPDAQKAREALVLLADRPRETLPVLRERLQPVARPEQAKLDKLLAELQDNRFNVRKKATEDLEKLAELAEPTLQKCLEGNPPLEVKTRVDQLIQKLKGPVTQPDRLRALRAGSAGVDRFHRGAGHRANDGQGGAGVTVDPGSTGGAGADGR